MEGVREIQKNARPNISPVAEKEAAMRAILETLFTDTQN
jgi:hypothetical protein